MNKKSKISSLKNDQCNSYVQYFLLLAMIAAFLLCYYPVIHGLIGTWSHSDESSHGFFIFPISLYIVWNKRDVIAKVKQQSSWVGFVLVIFSLFTFMVARMAMVLTIVSLTMILFLAGVILFFYGWMMLKELSFPLFLLLFMIPVPNQIYSTLTLPLQLIVTKISVVMASLSGVSVIREGNVINIPGHTLEVVQACSGLRSLTSLLTLAIIIGYFTLNSNILRGLLFISAVPVAILVNIFRVMVMVVSLYYLNFDLTEGSIHTYYGLAVFALALVLLMIIRRILLFWDNSATQRY